jgi:hypothetical protein
LIWIKLSCDRLSGSRIRSATTAPS